MEYLSAANCYITLFHNGYKVLECMDGKTVLDFISTLISADCKQAPKLIIDEFLDGFTELGGERILIVYEYTSEYKDMFLVEMN